MERGGETFTVKPDMEPYRQLIFAVARQAWDDIQLYLKYRKRGPEKQELHVLNRRERDFRTSIHFFVVPYGEGRYQDTSYFAYLMSLLGTDEGAGVAQKAKQKCLQILAELNPRPVIKRRAGRPKQQTRRIENYEQV